MEPISAFVSIVGLLAEFVSQRNAGESKSYDDFMSWLAETRHDDLRTLLESNTDTTVSIKALLNDSREQILRRLSEVDKTLVRVASGIDGYRELARATHPEALLSDQALSILQQFYDSGASKVLESHLMSGVILTFVDGSYGSLDVSEPRFVEDDLDVLLATGLLGLDHNSKGDRLFKFTRAAAMLVEQVRSANENSSQ